MNKKKFKIDKEATKEFRNWYRKLKPEEKFLARLVERQNGSLFDGQRTVQWCS